MNSRKINTMEFREIYKYYKNPSYYRLDDYMKLSAWKHVINLNLASVIYVRTS